MKVIQSKEGEIFDIELSEDLLKKNEEIALQNKQILDKANVLAIPEGVNISASNAQPGDVMG